MSTTAPRTLSYEIIGASLRKIKNVASSRKYAKLTDEAKRLLEVLSDLQQGKNVNLDYYKAAPVPAPASKESANVELSTSRTTDESEVEAAGAAAEQPPSAEDSSSAPSAEPADADVAQQPTDGSDPDGAVAATDPEHSTASPAVDDAAVDAGASEPAAAATDLPQPPPPVVTAAHQRDLPSRSSPANSPPKSPGKSRTQEALSNDLCIAVVKVMRIAVETHKPAIVEAALDCLQKMITHRLLQGAVTAINVDKPGSAAKEFEASKPQSGIDPTTHTPQAQAVELMCRCDDIPDEAVEVQVLRGLLCATTSATFTLHGQALLLAVRTCYNIYLVSRSEVNQTTAKASLTQMLNVVFLRMEKNSMAVPIRPIVVSDVLGLSKSGAGDSNPLANTVQSFVNTVVATTSYIATGHAPTDDLRNSVAGAFEGRVEGEVGNSSDSEDEREQFQLGRSASTPAEEYSEASSPKAELRVGLLQKDAFLVFRALCKLSIRTSDSATVTDPTAVRGKVLALELLKLLLENSGEVFRTSEKFLSAIRQYLCLSLLKNSASSVPQALQLTCSIFCSLLHKFRQVLKAEVGVFFPMILLKAIEPPASSGPPAAPVAGTPSVAQGTPHRTVVLKYLREMCSDGQLLVDLFVNYDCDIEGSNLFERMVLALVKMAQTNSAPGDTANQNQADQFLRQEALQCLVDIMASLQAWYLREELQQSDALSAAEDSQLNSAGSASTALLAARPPQASTSLEDLSAAATPQSPSGQKLAHSPSSSRGELQGAVRHDEESGEALSRQRAYKLKFQEGVALFNKKTRKGIELLQAEGILGPSPEEVATFLAKTEGLNKTMIGDYLGEREDFALKVMHAYVDAMRFENMPFDEAIRSFLNGFRLPGEAQKIDRLMEKFAERFVKCNPSSFKSADVAYVLAYSVIMLNTDAHNPQVKEKMQKEAFLKNNRGINDGADLADEFMGALYDRIVSNEIKMKEDVALAAAAAADNASGAMAAAAAAKNFVNTLLSLMGAYKETRSSEPSDDAIKRTLEYLHQKAKGLTFFSATEGDTVKPILDVIWAPLLGALSVLFEEYSDPQLVRMCLSGFQVTVCLTARLGMAELRDVYLMALCNFTHLHSPSTMRFKNALAFKHLLQVAAQVGNHLQDKWIHVLRCISRWELLQQMASGMPTDAVLFAMQQHPTTDKGLRAAAEAVQKKFKDMAVAMRGPEGDERSSVDSLTMSEATIKKASGQGGDGKDGGINQDVINSVDSSEINTVFIRSPGLDSEAIVDFIKALKMISLDELKIASAPRVFSLAKIVEIAHYNMSRIRLVWSRIWSILSDYFITVGCHSNLSVAMYAMDSLRQLAVKFLERDELANYTFQNDFLRPFVVVMRQSQAVEIRELIIRCLSQMVLARVQNVKSGWKSMFMVFTTAASDREPTIVRLAFNTIEKIVREHFSHITATETTTFTDCVNCLIAFTNNPHSLDVALNSIAFLRFCAMRLAEGDIGNVESLPEEERPAVIAAAGLLLPTRISSIDRHGRLQQSGTPTSGAGSPFAPGSSHDTAMKFTDREEHVYFWFPLLAGLSELTFDPREEIRNGALEVLFDTLKFHGASFAAPFWARIFDSVLLPIFDHVRAEVTDTTTFTSEKRRAQEDAWLFETCTKCLQHLVDLYVQFYPVVSDLLSRLADLLVGFMRRTHQSLASVGVAGFVRLVTTAGTLLTPEQWDEVLSMVLGVVCEALPDAEELATAPGRSGAEGPPSPSTAGRQYTLREGIGARRLAKFRCKSSVQLMLVQACGEVYSSQHLNLTPSAATFLLDMLERTASHARQVDTNMSLRCKLTAQQAQDRVAEDKQVSDPPLLRLETEASHAYLSILLHITMLNNSPALLDYAHVDTRLAELCSKVLSRFCDVSPTSVQAPKAPPAPTTAAPFALKASIMALLTSKPGDINLHARASQGLPVHMASPAAELAQLAPLVVAVLRALSSLSDSTFKVRLQEFFPLLTRLIRCEVAPAEVHQALSDLFSQRVGPLLQGAAAKVEG